MKNLNSCECGTCQQPTSTVKVDKQVLFKLMHSHSRLAQAEYHRNPSYTDSHFSAAAEIEISQRLSVDIMGEYFDYVDKVDSEI